MLSSIRKPNTRFVAGSEDGDARGLHGGGEVHGSAVVPNEDTGLGEDGSALARGQKTA